MAKNENLTNAKIEKNDEFYTQLTDIEKELKHYKEHFRGKTVLCNCDDPRVSNFFKYFSLNFETLGLKKLITTCYKSQYSDLFSRKDSEKAIYVEYEGDKNGNRMPDIDESIINFLDEDGDFRSAECIELLKEADIVVTNPPFSLFREYIAQLIEYDKKFLIIGNMNAVTYKEVFKLIMQNKVWLGVTKPKELRMHDSYPLLGSSYINEDGHKMAKLPNLCWFTNLEHKVRNESLYLYKDYDPKDYPNYDNYDAIEVSKVANIPKDYYQPMGVPITFLEKYNPEQFEILGIDRYIKDNPCPGRRFNLNGKEVYARIIIRNRNPIK